MLSKPKKLLLSIFTIIASAIYVTVQGVSDKTPSTPNSNKLSVTEVPSSPETNIPSNSNKGIYTDGEFLGSPSDAYYGNIKVKAVIRNGKLADVQFLDFPQDRQTSISINQGAMKRLKQEAIQAQSANVKIVSGATDTSLAFQDSLNSALNQAKM